MSAVRGYIANFFQCSDCSKHFTARISKPDAGEVATRRDAVLWIWGVHNEVGREGLSEFSVAEHVYEYISRA